MTREQRAKKIIPLLKKAYPKAECALCHRNAWELLIATILSAQCTDARVNVVTPALFKRFPNAHALAEGDIRTIELLIRSTGFYHSKAKAIKESSRRIVEKFHGKIPRTMEELITLRGVARKTANVVLGAAFHKNVGVVVDTHVRRLANRLGFTRNLDPVAIERDLMRLFPQKEWTKIAHLLILHGRKTCTARKPKCGECPLQTLCPSAFKIT